MKKCPYCAEEIQDAAVFCKHCKSTLSQSPTLKTESLPNKSTSSKTSSSIMKWPKYIAIATLLTLSLFIWYISIPAVIIWYVWWKKKFNHKLRIGLTAILAILAIWGIYYFVIPPKTPVLAITAPTNNIEIQSQTATIRGTVDPASTKVFITKSNIPVEKDGSFIYEAKLEQETNVFTVTANNRGSVSTKSITIKRIFTPEELAERTRQQAEASAKVEQNRIKSLKNRLQMELESFNKPFNANNYRESATAIGLEIGLFSTWAKLINQAKIDSNLEIKKMGEDLEQKVSSLQIKEFPIIRKAFAEVLRRKLWTEDVDVEVLGSSNKTLELVAIMFATNKNIADVHLSIQDTLTALRFTRVNYKWSEYSKYSYFTIDSEPDSKVTETNIFVSDNTIIPKD